MRCAGETGNLDALLRSLDLVLTPAVDAAASLADQAEPGQSPTPDSSASRTSISDLLVGLETLREQIEANNLSARKRFADVRGDLMGRGIDELVTGLEANLGKLDFSAALSRLNDIVAGLGNSTTDMQDTT